ncbi:MAG: hypothetical protein Fur0022_03410 [Anaerolineales bacterium]
MFNLLRSQSPDDESRRRGELRLAIQPVNDAIPSNQIGKRGAEEGGERVWGFDKAGEERAQGVRGEGVGVAGEGVVACRFGEDGAGVRPAVGPGVPVPGVDEVQGGQRGSGV